MSTPAEKSRMPLSDAQLDHIYKSTRPLSPATSEVCDWVAQLIEEVRELRKNHSSLMYVVSTSDCYYPGAGVEDWVFCGPDLNAAMRCLEECKDADYKYLIGISATGTYKIIAGDRDDSEEPSNG